jgi:RsiW-degrading membrane proteinase PrsW (M82 family)
VRGLLAVVPVLLFLAALLGLDRFRLVRLSSVLTALAAGGIAALVCHALQAALAGAPGAPVSTLARVLGPLTEEVAKAVYVVFLLRSGRAGFLVDAAIQGFAVGAGFGVVENVVYLQALPDAPLLLWLVRGLGTAVLHGATTTVVALLAKALGDRRPDRWLPAALPGLAVAVAVHAAFNLLPLPPVAMTAVLLIAMPLLVLAVFEQSERVTHDWVGAGLDLDVEILSLVGSDAFASTRFGAYLRELRERFPGPVVADMYCLLRLHLELSVQAKARVLAREAGLEIPDDGDLRAAFDEIAALDRSIGPTGRLALRPLQVTSHRDAWHRHLLRQARKPVVPRR